MKNINIPLEDKDYDLLNTAKPDEMTWREFILTLVTPKKKKRGR